MPTSSYLRACLGTVLSASFMLTACTTQSPPSVQPNSSYQNPNALDPSTITYTGLEKVDMTDNRTPAKELTHKNGDQPPFPTQLEGQAAGGPTQTGQIPVAPQQSQPAPQSPSAELAPKKAKQPDKPSRTTALQQNQNHNKKRLTLSQLIKKYPDLLLLHGPIGSNKVALTFDDAPDTKYTPQVLNILKKYNVKATFFVVGRLVEKHPGVVRRMAQEGHVVGNHTFNHSLLTRLSDEQFQAQVNRTQKLLKSTIGYTPKLLRPPYGEISESQLLWATSHHFTVVNWNVDSKDWKQLDQAQVTANVLNHAKAGSIILQHSGGGPEQNLSGTVSALPTIIESLQSRGYHLVTLPELLKIPK